MEERNPLAKSIKPRDVMMGITWDRDLYKLVGGRKAIFRESGVPERIHPAMYPKERI